MPTKSKEGSPPIIGLACDHKQIGQLAFHAAGEKYIDAVRHASGAFPMLIPVSKPPLDVNHILSAVDGIFLPGSPSNVNPELYGGVPTAAADDLADPQRDQSVLPLIRAAIAQGVPLLAICRGFQELNVAYGGTLHPLLHTVPGRDDHRADPDGSVAERHAAAHKVNIVPGGKLASVLGSARDIMVNSLHWQGIDRLAENLSVEATAPDGTIEAVSVSGASGFALGVQWHPEWQVTNNPAYAAIFQAFGDAARAREK